jgi:hypothetical protein
MTRGFMNGNDIIALGLGLQSPWEIVGQTLNTDTHPLHCD